MTRKRSVCYFKTRDIGRKKSGKNRRRPSVMIADDQTRAKISRLVILQSFVSEREDFVINTLNNFEPMERFENRRDMMKFGCFGGGSSC